MKSSALRTWLRRERAREHAFRMYGRLFAIHGPAERLRGDGIVLACAARGIREPRADVHIHGRDCDWALGGCMTCLAT